ILAVLALALVVMMVGGMIWLIGIGVEAMSKGERGKGLTGAGRSTSDFPGKLWQQARGKKPKATATATYVPPPAPPAPKLPPPPKQYEVKCPTCATPLIATAGAGVGCPKCGTKMSVTPA
ncbi:MAG TPA: hypothetical protein VND98_11195, partial [Solirubrobacterales bacterium]|nr:hypothetical protein [Solirubrobacterales bacterium]